MNASSVYRVSASHTASPVRLVIMLYEQLIKDLQRALVAMDKKDIEARTNELSHALLVVGQLQATLKLEEGQDVSQRLNDFYHILREQLLHAQMNASSQILRKHIGYLLDLREAWLEVERDSRNESTAQATSTTKSLPGEKSLSWSF